LAPQKDIVDNHYRCNELGDRRQTIKSAA
jgi:hypothetical protein